MIDYQQGNQVVPWRVTYRYVDDTLVKGQEVQIGPAGAPPPKRSCDEVLR